MSSEVTVLNEIVEEQRKHIAQLVSQVEDLRLQFDLVLNERNEAMDERASARSVHEALVRNITSMSEFAGKAMRERDAARAEVEKLREQVARAEEERRHAVAALSEQVDTARAERDIMQEIVDEQRGQIAKLVERVVELTKEVSSVTEERRHAVAPILERAAVARAERDEARREVCELRCNPPEPFIGLPHELAQVNGWDCFRENTDGT